jgi:hypothetical protein
VHHLPQIIAIKLLHDGYIVEIKSIIEGQHKNLPRELVRQHVFLIQDVQIFFCGRWVFSGESKGQSKINDQWVGGKENKTASV